MNRIILILTTVFLSQLASGQETNHALVRQLDENIRRRPLYQAEKESRITELKTQLMHELDDSRRYDIYNSLFQEYSAYSTDSLLVYARRKMVLAQRMDDSRYLEESTLNMIEVLSTTGMYIEALELLTSIHSNSAYYYHLCRSTYGWLADYAIPGKERDKYARITDLYRDTLLAIHRDNPVVYSLIKADRLIVHGKYREAIDTLDEIYPDTTYTTRTEAQIAYTYSEAYHFLGDRENEKKFLLISSIADIQSAVREYISLRKLAILTYQEGDVERAYNYLKCSLEDAIQCNARLRTLEISQVFPIIDKAYRDKAEYQKRRRGIFSLSISVLSFFLLISLFHIYRQMKKITAARREVIEANRLLKRLNNQLNQFNAELKSVNHTLSHTNRIKEEYIGKYMDQCSAYLDKMEVYRRSLGKLAAAGKVEELYRTIKSTRFIEEELEDFYAGFDETFLNLFPTFVEDFNALLADKIYPKAGERLNTELRIFALIRLEITDSVKIAHFLRYSVTTIYNYRTRVRNRAMGERDEFENKVMGIGM